MGAVQRVLAEWLIVALVLFALLVEFVLHKIEHWIAHRQPQLQTVLRNLYRELMILGMVSFGFLLFLFIAEPPKDIVFTFEVAHIFIFLFAVFHTITVLVSIVISLRLSNRWKGLEGQELKVYLAKKDAYRKLNELKETHASVWWRWVGWWFPNPGRALRYWKLHEVMAFHDTRFQFIYYRNLDPAFNFASFLRKTKSATFIELVEIHWTQFLFMLIFVLLDIGRMTLGGQSPIFEPIFLMGNSVFNMLLVALLGSKIRRVYWKMTKNPALYYNSVNLQEIEEERLIAKEEALIDRERGGGSSRTSLDAPQKPRVRVGGLQSQQPLYAGMTGAGSAHGAPPVLDTEAIRSRHSLEVRKGAPSALDTETIRSRHSVEIRKGEDAVVPGRPPAPRPSAAKPGLYIPGDAVALDIPAAGVPRSSDDTMRLALPTDELKDRTARSKSIRVRGQSVVPSPLVEDMDKMERVMSARSERRAEAVRRINKRNRPTASIAKNARDQEAAQNASPERNYPRWVLWFVPRLGRVASPPEKLFWFGSHRFYFWCVEWVLFFATINLSATLAILGFALKDAKGKGKDKAAKSGAAVAKFVVRAAADTAKAKADGKTAPKQDLLLLSIALIVAIVALVYILTRIAGIMKKYIFVLNNANLLPESMTIQAIQNIGLKRLLNRDLYGDSAETSYNQALESDAEEDSSFRAKSADMRRGISSFLGTEAEKGYMPGVSTSPAPAVNEQSPLFV